MTLLAALLTLPLFILEMGSHLIPALHGWILDMMGMGLNWGIQFVLTDLSPKFPPALRGVLGVKSVTLGRHLVHRLFLQKLHGRQIAQS